MYKFTNIEKEDLSFLELKYSKGKIKAILCMSESGRLDQLIVDDINVIKTTNSRTYNTDYKSSILFPFANRIRNGAYTFNDCIYQLTCNESDRNNAIHGIIYNNKFEVVDSDLTVDFGSVTLNNDKSEFPFTVSWHPYFETKELYSSYLHFKSNTQFLVDTEFIPCKKIDFNETMPFQIKHTILDDGFQLESPKVEFLTPEYQLTLKSKSHKNYLQLYFA